MQPKISEQQHIILVGLSFYGDPFDTHNGWDEDNHIGRLWKRLMRYLEQHPGALPNQERLDAWYEVHIYSPESGEKGLFEVFVGIQIDLQAVDKLPVDLVVKVLPITRYAIFTFNGTQITSDWDKVLQDWLATSGYTTPFNYNFQYYDRRFKGMDRLEASELDVYLPICKAG
jgi:predicted transcriptional regulator YdeE